MAVTLQTRIREDMVVKDDNLDRADFGGEKNRKEHTIVFEKETFFSLAKVGGWVGL